MNSELNDEILLIYNIPIKIKNYISTYPVNYKNINIPETRITLSIGLFFLFLLSDIIIKLILGSLGFIISYQVYYIYAGRKTGEYSVAIIKIKNIHVHHWIYCSIIVIMIWVLGMNSPFIIGVCFGGITHGIQYSDWNVIVE